MADEQENIKLQFDTNAKQAAGDVNKLAGSIDQTTESTEQSNKEFKKSEEQFKSYKQQLKEAVIEQQKLAQQFGATSAQATEAAKKVAIISDEMQFQKDLAKSYNPDEKFRALTQTAGLAALALGGVKDGLSALGIESKVLDKVIGTAQAILGVTSAVAGVTDAYEVLTAAKKASSAADLVQVATTEAVAVAEGEATVATWSFNSALLANPAIAITAAVVALVAITYTYIKVTGDAAKEEEKLKVASLQLTEAIDHQAKSFENNSKYISAQNAHKLALLKASGASEAQIYKETTALANQELQLAKNYRTEALILEQRAYEQNRDNPTEFTEKSLANAQENLEKAKKAVSDGYDSLISLQQGHQVAVVQAQTDADKEAEKKRQEAHDKALQQQKTANEKRLQEEAAFRLKMIELADANQTKEFEERQANIQAQSDQIGKEEEAITNAQIQKEKDNNDYFANEAETRIAREKDIADKRLAAKQQEQDSLNNLGNSAINAVKTLAGKNKQIQKAAIITDGAVGVGKAVASTAEAVTKDLAKGFPFSIPLVALDVAVGATSIASIVQGTNKALQAVGGGSISGGSVQAAPRSAAPQVAFNNTAENQIGQSVAKTQAEQPPLQVNVLESDITKAQSNVKVLVDTNSF